MQARMEQDLARLRDTLDPSEFDRVRDELEKAFHKFRIGLNRQRRGPEDGGLPALVKPPRGPKPLAGGAAAPLEFD